MADNDKEELEEAAAPKSKKGLILILVGLLVVVGAGGFAVWKFVLSDTPADGEEGKTESAKQVETETIVYSLSPFVVNLFDTKGSRYLKLKVELELINCTEDDVKKKEPKIRDSLIILLSSKKYEEIGSIEGKLRLREEITYRINSILGEGKVKGIFFTDFVVQ